LITAEPTNLRVQFRQVLDYKLSATNAVFKHMNVTKCRRGKRELPPRTSKRASLSKEDMEVNLYVFTALPILTLDGVKGQL
jgi:hypothetical protein